MSQTVNAIFENGVLRPLDRLDLSERQQVRVTVDSLEPERDKETDEQPIDPLEGVGVSTGIPDLAENFDDFRFGRREPWGHTRGRESFLEKTPDPFSSSLQGDASRPLASR